MPKFTKTIRARVVSRFYECRLTEPEFASRAGLDLRTVHDVLNGMSPGCYKSTMTRMARALDRRATDLAPEWFVPADTRLTKRPPKSTAGDQKPRATKTQVALPPPDGNSLYHRLYSDPTPETPSLKDSLGLIRRILDRASTLHEGGHAHGSITPLSIVFLNDNHVDIVPGLVLPQFPDDKQRSHSVPLGFAPYLSPGQLSNLGRPVFADDVYSLGQVAFLLLTGLTPIGKVPPLGELRPDCPIEITELLERMRSHKVQDRPANAQEVTQAFTRGLRAARERQLQKRWGEGHAETLAKVERHQRERLDSLEVGRIRLKSDILLVLRQLLDGFGPFWLGSIEPKVVDASLARGSFTYDSDQAMSDYGWITCTYLRNRLTDRWELIGDTDIHGSGKYVDENTLSRFSESLKRLQSRSRALITDTFGHESVHRVKATCKKCHSPLQRIFNLAPPPFGPIAICPQCSAAGHDIPHCAGCGSLILGCNATDELGDYECTGCPSCRQIFDPSPFGESPWKTWNGDLKPSKSPPRLPEPWLDFDNEEKH